MSEDELRSALQALGGTTDAPAGARDRVLSALARRRRRRYAVGSTVVGAAMVAAIVTTVSVVGGPAGDPVDDSADPSVVDTGWRAIAESPLSPRQGEVAVWTGEMMVVIGGHTDPPCPPAASCVWNLNETTMTDGAAYDPTADSWRPISDLPVRLIGLGAAWTGTEIVLTGERARPPGERGFPTWEAWAYDVAADSWRELDYPTLGPLGGGTPTDDGRLIYSASEGDRSGSEAWSLDIASGEWRPIGALPWDRTFDRTFTWLGGELHATALLVDEVETDDGAGPYVHAKIDEDTRTWEVLPRTPVDFWENVWYAFDGRLVNPTQGDRLGFEEYDASSSGVWDPETGVWRTAPQLASQAEYDKACPLPSVGPAGDWLAHDRVLISLDPERVIATPPCPSYAEVHTAIWTGSELILWGATGKGYQENLAEGLRWTPPKP